MNSEQEDPSELTSFEKSILEAAHTTTDEALRQRFERACDLARYGRRSRQRRATASLLPLGAVLVVCTVLTVLVYIPTAYAAGAFGHSDAGFEWVSSLVQAFLGFFRSPEGARECAMTYGPLSAAAPGSIAAWGAALGLACFVLSSRARALRARFVQGPESWMF